ncbi:hypothetical protein J6590_072167 [Homalodisca vitripennis]|nr:hypothetical protein J6590_072167 [Homalodisca vitripennis]
MNGMTSAGSLSFLEEETQLVAEMSPDPHFFVSPVLEYESSEGFIIKGSLSFLEEEIRLAAEMSPDPLFFVSPVLDYESLILRRIHNEGIPVFPGGRDSISSGYVTDKDLNLDDCTHILQQVTNIHFLLQGDH